MREQNFVCVIIAVHCNMILFVCKVDVFLCTQKKNRYKTMSMQVLHAYMHACMNIHTHTNTQCSFCMLDLQWNQNDELDSLPAFKTTITVQASKIRINTQANLSFYYIVHCVLGYSVQYAEIGCVLVRILNPCNYSLDKLMDVHKTASNGL
jgi:hypothetical protein